MNDWRSYESWRIVRLWPAVPEQDLLMGHQAAQAHGVDADAGRARCHRGRPPTVSTRVGSAPHSADAAAMRLAVNRAVPEGASTLASWCSSMISAVSNHGAASSAKRIISTAPMAKLGATTQPGGALWREGSRQLGQGGVVEAGRADHRMDAVRRRTTGRWPWRRRAP